MPLAQFTFKKREKPQIVTLDRSKVGTFRIQNVYK